MKYIVQREERFLIDREVDIQVGDVFIQPMRGWELHVKALLDDENVLIWREYGSKQQHLPLEKRTDGLSVESVQSLTHYYSGPFRGGEYSYEQTGGYGDGCWATRDNEFIGVGPVVGVAHSSFGERRETKCLPSAPIDGKIRYDAEDAEAAE